MGSWLIHMDPWGQFYKIQNSAGFRFRNESAKRERADLTNQRVLSAPNLKQTTQRRALIGQINNDKIEERVLQRV